MSRNPYRGSIYGCENCCALQRNAANLWDALARLSREVSASLPLMRDGIGPSNQQALARLNDAAIKVLEVQP